MPLLAGRLARRRAFGQLKSADSSRSKSQRNLRSLNHYRVNYYFRCPKCGSDEEFIKPSEESSNLGCAIFFFGGLIPALLFAADQTHGRIQCVNCAHIFRQPRIPVSPIAAFAGWIVALLIVPILIAVIAGSADLASFLPSVPIIASMEDAIKAEPRLAAYVLAFVLALIILVCWAAAFVSNSRFRKQLSTRCRLKALSPDELAQKQRDSDLPIETVTHRNLGRENPADDGS